MSIFGKLSFKDQAFKLRESAILDAATSILGSKGYDLMTMDDVAGAIGISKPSLYKHFKSKEELVGEALIRLIDGAVDHLATLDKSLTAFQKSFGFVGMGLTGAPIWRDSFFALYSCACT